MTPSVVLELFGKLRVPSLATTLGSGELIVEPVEMAVIY